ncbi:MAG: 4Fe-4S binding protein [Loktanella sp.]|nr:4Fe-4S binding protein [Loktanella sp.]
MTAIRARNTARNASAVPMRLALSACLTVQRPDAACNACAVACPEYAIAIHGRDVTIQVEACSGCGLCAPSCPTGAINVAFFGPAARLDCARVRKPAGRAVPCLGGLTDGHLRAALEQGDVTLVDRGWCRDCALSGGVSTPWAQTVGEVNAEMALLDVPQRVHVAQEPLSDWRAKPAPQAPTDNPSRRRLFNALADNDALNVPVDNIPDKTVTPRLAQRAAQLARIARTNAVPRSLFPKAQVTGPVADLNVLARLCPTNALKVTEDAASRALIFDPTACTECGICVATGLIAFEPAESWHFTGSDVLLTEPRATCSLCRSRFTPNVGQSTCTACARDNAIAALGHGLMRRQHKILHEGEEYPHG